MTGAWDLTTAHQLLGRIVYFHALFIEPALTRRASATPGTLCCNHDGFSPGQKPASVVLQGTAWAALDDVSVTLPAFYQRCPAVADNCCAVCRVAAASAAIATCWADTEYRAYHQSDESARVRACGQAAAVRIGAAFATLRSAACPTLN